MKKVICMAISLVTLLAMVGSISVFAVGNQDSVITFEEYYDAVRSAYARHGVEYEVIAQNPSFVFTQEILNEKLEAIEAAYATNNTKEAESSSWVAGNQGIAPTAYMPVERKYRYTEEVRSPEPAVAAASFADICITVYATVDIEHDDLMYINSYESYQLGYAYNFVSWEEKDIFVDMDARTDTFYAEATGIVTFEYTEAHTGLTIRHSSEHTISHTFSVDDYIS